MNQITGKLKQQIAQQIQINKENYAQTTLPRYQKELADIMRSTKNMAPTDALAERINAGEELERVRSERQLKMNELHEKEDILFGLREDHESLKK